MPRTRPLRPVLAVLAVLGLAAATQSAVGTATAAPPAYTVRPGTHQVEVLDATPGQAFELVKAGKVVASGTADVQGSLEWRLLPTGIYTVRTPAGGSVPARVTGMHTPV